MALMPSMVVEHWRGGKWSSGAGDVVVGSVAVAVLVVLFCFVAWVGGAGGKSRRRSEVVGFVI